MEKIISEILGFVITVIITVTILIFGILWYHVNQYNDYKEKCIQVIQRTGNLNDPTLQALGTKSSNNSKVTKKNSISRDFFNGHFYVTRPRMSDGNSNDHRIDWEASHHHYEYNYGSPIVFVIHSDIPLSSVVHNGFFKEFDHTNHIKGDKLVHTKSEVRLGSQDNVQNNYSPNNYDQKNDSGPKDTMP